MTPPGGGRPSQSVVFQVGHHEFHLHAEPPEVADALAFVAQRAEHDLPVHRTARYTVAAEDGRYRVDEDGDLLLTADTAEAVLEALYARVAARAVELTCRLGWSRLHAGSVDVAGRRLLLLGDSGAGKTTLTLAVGAAGGRVQADEITLVRAGEAVALARRFHCKPGTELLLPAFADAIARSPRAHHAGEEIRAVDPSELGLPWRITAVPIDAVVLLTADRTAVPVLERVPSPVAMPVLAQGVLRFVESAAQVRAQLVRLLARPVWRLQSGPVDATAEALTALAASL